MDQAESNVSAELQHALSELDSRSRSVVEARWLNDNKSETLNELASKFKVSAERIRQIEKNAFKKIRALMISNASI